MSTTRRSFLTTILTAVGARFLPKPKREAKYQINPEWEKASHEIRVFGPAFATAYAAAEESLKRQIEELSRKDFVEAYKARLSV